MGILDFLFGNKKPVGVFTTFSSNRGMLQQAHPSSVTPPPGINQNPLGSGISFVHDPCKPRSQQKAPSVVKLFTVNPVSIPGLPATKIMLFNPNRTRFTVTNIGTTIVYIGLGNIPTPSSYDHVLPGCTNANDGTGGVIVDEDFQGDVWAIPSGTGGTIAITEQP